MKIHYIDAGFRRRACTPCGLPLYREQGGYFKASGTPVMRTSENLDTVTCKRCVRAWNAFVRRGGA